MKNRGNVKPRKSTRLNSLRSLIFPQVRSALYALDHDVCVVICNGMQEKAVKQILSGRRLGTFFTKNVDAKISGVETMAENGNDFNSRNIRLS